MIVECSDPSTRSESIDQAAQVLGEGQIIVLPTDTVYGVGADAFDEVAVAMVLAAKRRDRTMPPPVLVPSARTVDGLATHVPMYAKILMRRFWPGPLTLVLRAQTSLAWDLGETNGTVALRMPNDEVALELLEQVGPMAVTSANLTGQPAATTAQEAAEQLGRAVELYLDAGPRRAKVASTIVDCTGDEPVVLRHGALAADVMREVLGTTVLHDDPPTPETLEPDGASAANDGVVEHDAVPGQDLASRSGPEAQTPHGARMIGTVRGIDMAFRKNAVCSLPPRNTSEAGRPPTV